MTDQEKIIEAIERELFSALSRKYVQRADDRQRAMGLVYTEAETHDLARFIARVSHAICAPAVRERCAEVADEVECSYGEMAVPVWPDGPEIAAAIRALPLDGLTGGKGESELEKLGREACEMLAASAPAPVQAVLKNPVAVHLNMMRGGIAKLTPAQIGHLYRGEEARAVVSEVIRQNPDDFLSAPAPVQAGKTRDNILAIFDVIAGELSDLRDVTERANSIVARLLVDGLITDDTKAAPVQAGLSDADKHHIDTWRVWLSEGIDEKSNQHVIARLIRVIDDLLAAASAKGKSDE